MLGSRSSVELPVTLTQVICSSNTALSQRRKERVQCLDWSERRDIPQQNSTCNQHDLGDACK
jgi:hypothetical protein